ncbi:uncharacterized protein LOC106160157 [Lingula anatina]|uniref:Uncharacterized protein LOC106160157 n=1 Tax=Lingula anatina TaxID=7574 RepID=A0A1S3I1I7_LINAN|nr:uncharacterized protein LOC106160157 [Lingula anatina]|eukprot:XP_013392130.1 uncharacterized protein LOC106160157 [Lingula anatina]
MATCWIVNYVSWSLFFISLKDLVTGEECYSCSSYTVKFDTDNILGSIVSTPINNALAKLPTDEDCEASRIASLGTTSCNGGCEKANVTMHFNVQFLGEHRVSVRTVSRGCANDASAGSSVLISDNGCRKPAGKDDLFPGADAVFKILESVGAPTLDRQAGEECVCRGNLCNSSTSLFACGILLASCLFLTAALKSVL